MSKSILEVRDLCVAYGKVEALHDANIRVGEGQIVTVIGPNGAGKTTMLSAIMGCSIRTASSSSTASCGLPRRSRTWLPQA